MTSTLEHEDTIYDEEVAALEKMVKEVPETTRRGLAIGSFADTTYADNQDWGPARLREDYLKGQRDQADSRPLPNDSL